MNRFQLPLKYRNRLVERFLTYVTYDTASDDKASEDKCPTTAGQFVLARQLVKELQELGVTDTCASEYGYVYGTIHENLPEGHPAKGTIPTFGLMSHLDTAQAQSGRDVNPRILNYQGGDIVFPDDQDLLLTVRDNPELEMCRGDLITASGGTLLGADDKAGIAEIMTVADYLLHENVPHGEIRVCFNPDEEVTRGTAKIDIERFAVKYAFTLDGSREGEIEDECFNAKTAYVRIEGVDVHPGYGKGKLVNAFRVFAWIVSHLPEENLPETTDGREPYRFPYECLDVPKVDLFKINFLLRAFTEHELDEMERVLCELCSQAEKRFPGSKVTINVKAFYKNMKVMMDEHPLVMQLLEEACHAQGITPIHKPIRGGTDGSALTIKHGIPTPNVWAGGMNFHSRTEWIPVAWMVSAVETMIKMFELCVDHYSSSKTT